jgi:phosphohistidine phosphatase
MMLAASMDLYILRHAIAVEHGTAGYERDSDRPLTNKGERKMRCIAEAMRSLELSFDLILSSPFVRARQTAEIVANVFGMEKRLEFTKNLAVGGNKQELINELNKNYADMKRIILVGHEPYLSGLISVLIAGNEGLFITMKKGGVCALTIDSLQYGKCATLEWLLAPSQLTRIE